MHVSSLSALSQRAQFRRMHRQVWQWQAMDLWRDRWVYQLARIQHPIWLRDEQKQCHRQIKLWIGASCVDEFTMISPLFIDKKSSHLSDLSRATNWSG
jgi:hypothetical protein